MGDWFQSCCVTNLPIIWHEEVVVLVPKPDVPFFLHNELSYEQARRDLQPVLRGTYDFSGQLTGYPDFNDWDHKWTVWIKAFVWDEIQKLYHEDKHLGDSTIESWKSQDEMWRHYRELTDETIAAAGDLLGPKLAEMRERYAARPEPLNIADSAGVLALIWFCNCTSVSLGPRYGIGENCVLANHRRLIKWMQQGIRELKPREDKEWC